MKKRTLSLLLCLVMCLTLVPMTAFATGTEEVGGKTLPYSFDFETDMAAEGWTNIDADGDEYDWRTDTDALWDEKLGIDEGHCAISRSYVNNVGPRNADNWLFSPAITIPEGGATVSWYEQSQDVSYPDFYEVYVSETNTSTDTSKMTKIFSGIAANPWNQRSVELEAAEYAGKTVYIAFRHHSYDCYMLEIDNFAVGAEAPAHTHTVTFDANGGSVTPTSAETGTDGKLATLPTPTRSGSYSFDGWYTMKEGGTKVDTNTVFTAAATIYAHWSRSFSFAHLPKTGVATITVHEGDYYTGLAAKDAFILYWDENIKTDGNFILIDYFDTYDNSYHSWIITIENGVPVARDGGFMEYYTTLDLINDFPFYASYDKWVNGTYSAIHTVTVQNDGNGTASADTSSAAKGDTVTLTATPNTGYHFKEWQSSDVTVSGDAFTMPEKNVTVKAIFEADAPTTYTVTFNMNGHGTQVADQTVEDGNKATKPADPTAEGWTFDGWYADATFNVAFDFDAAINANTTVYAKWTPVHTHNYISVVTNPTCTEKGYTTHTCACGDSYVDTYITATGHTYGEWTITKEPTETETGLKERTCTVCKQTKTETVPKLVKTYTPGDVDGDGKISAADARLALRRSVGLEDYKEGSDKFLACDVDFNGKVSAADARLILRASVGLENPKTWKKA